MTGRWNPNGTGIAGLEWFPTRRLPIALKAGIGTGVALLSTASETVATVWARLQASVENTLVGLDIYDTADGIASIVGGVDLPTVDVAATTTGWESSTDAGATFATLTPGDAHLFVSKAIPDTYTPSDILALVILDGNVLRYLPTGSLSEGHLTFQGAGTYTKITDGTSGNSPSGQRVGWIEVDIACKAFNGSSATIDGLIRVGATNYGSDDGPRRISPHWARYTFRFMTNPATGRQWTSAEVAEFISAGNDSWGFSVRGRTPTNYQFASVQIVFRSLDEKRVATAYGTAHSADGYQGFNLLAPADHSAANWAKASGTNYLLSFFIAGNGGGAVLNTVDQLVPGIAYAALGSTSDAWTGVIQPTAPAGALASACPDRAGTLFPWAPSVYMELNPSAGGADAQPFVRPSVAPVGAATGIVAQAVTTHATALYGQALLLLGHFDETGAIVVPNDSLNVTLDGESFSIEPGEVPADGRLHVVKRHFGSAPSLNSGSGYDLELTSAATVPWHVGVVYTDEVGAPPTLAIPGTASFNGVSSGIADLLVSIGTTPAAPAGFAATAQTTTMTVPSPGGPALVGFADLTWTPTGLGGDFAYYEIARFTDVEGSTDWFSIGTIDNEGSASFQDREAARNVPESYAVRVVRTDGAYSDWSDISTVTIPTDQYCDQILASNLFGSLLAYQEFGDADPLHRFSRAQSTLSRAHPIAGRQYPAVFRPQIEGRSDLFERTLIIAMDVPGLPVDPLASDRWPLDVVLALLEEPTLPWVAFCDGRGRRWYTFAELVEGSFAWQGNEATATIRFTEVQGPSPVIVVV